MGEIDQTARDLARDALAQIGKHEGICLERWTAAKASFDAGSRKMEALADGQRAILRLLGWGGALIFTTVLGTAGWMASTLAGMALK
ncbi:MAG: hypothetical protein NBV67_02860 [Tagaea sp.]|nr:hypothetical protein [Tagaea sp.]